MKYVLELNETQARIISRALECFSRIGTAQYRIALETALSKKFFMMEPVIKDEVEKLCNDLKQFLDHLPPHSSHGISSHEISDDFRIAYDLHQVIRHRLWHDQNPDGGSWCVDAGDPMRTGPEGLAKISKG